MSLVFEVVDSTSPDQYYTLGLWLTLAEAVKAIEVDNPRDLGCEEADDFEDCRTVEIRERKLGWGGAGTAVVRVEWMNRYNEAEDTWHWTRIGHQV